MTREETPMWNDPEEPSYVRDLLEAGRGAPADYDVTQGLAVHLAHVKAGTPLPHWAKTGASGGMATGTMISWVAIPVVTAAIIAATYVAMTHEAQPAASPTATAVQPVIQAEPAALDLAAVQAAAQQVPRPTLAVPATHAEPAQSAKPVELTKPRAAEAVQQPSVAAKVVASPVRRSAGSQPSRGDTLFENAVPARPTATATATATATTSHASRVASAQSATSAIAERKAQREAEEETTLPQAAKAAVDAPRELDDSRLEREMRMLAVAQRVLSQDPARALRMAEQGEREFPSTMFSAERKQVALLAMVKLGRLEDARRIGQPFLSKYPNAPWSARLRRALATGLVE